MATRGAARSWKQDPQGRRERILEATEAEIRRLGIRALRTSAIAKRAGVAEGTLFHLFGSKDGLLAEVGRRYGEGLARAAFGGTALLEGDADVEALIDGIFAYVSENRALFEAFLWTSDPTVGVAASALRDEMVGAIAKQLEHGVAAGRLPAMDPQRAAEIQYIMVEGTVRECFVRHEGRHAPRYRRELVRCLAAMLGQTPSPATD